MATYYISPDGNNLNTGLGPDASNATNKPWLTIGKAMNTGSTVLPGDTVYVAPGVYYSEALVPVASISSVGSPTAFRGDPLNAQGFKNGSGVRRAPGIVMATTRTSAEADSSPASTVPGIHLGTNDVPGLQLYDMIVEGNVGINLHPGRATGFLAQDCRFMGHDDAMQDTSATPVAGRNWTFRRCIFIGSRSIAFQPFAAASTANADLNIVWESCLLIGRVTFRAGNNTANKGGGFHWRGCCIVAPGSTGITVASAGALSTVAQSDFEGCLFIGCTQVASSPDASVLVDAGYNRAICGATANTNVTEAGTTKRQVPPHLILPDLVKWGLQFPRGDFLGWSPDAHTDQKYSGWTNTAADFRGRQVRPWGSGASIGYVELGLIAQDTGSQITGGGANSLKVTGAGEVCIFVPVDAVSTTISVITKSTSYGGTNYPQLIAAANPDIGVTQQTDSAAAATEETLSVTFTPTAKGVVEVRLISRSSSVSSSTYFDVVTRA